MCIRDRYQRRVRGRNDCTTYDIRCGGSTRSPEQCGLDDAGRLALYGAFCDDKVDGLHCDAHGDGNLHQCSGGRTEAAAPCPFGCDDVLVECHANSCHQVPAVLCDDGTFVHPVPPQCSTPVCEEAMVSTPTSAASPSSRPLAPLLLVTMLLSMSIH
eukprot:TRINITY_DN2146_c0_g1_i2.p1 TRINITY_DN2146_c0_g1~~TRINITY_DN2146_c0_g1_i2.p1  ORF type:complete len:157 (+),score=56.48 TRINITY_DN2146_c0_g1_i2:53-523(+)